MRVLKDSIIETDGTRLYRRFFIGVRATTRVRRLELIIHVGLEVVRVVPTVLG